LHIAFLLKSTANEDRCGTPQVTQLSAGHVQMKTCKVILIQLSVILSHLHSQLSLIIQWHL